MGNKSTLRELAYFTKSALFTAVIHGILVAALLFGLLWPDSQNKAKRGSVQPIQATVISSEEIQRVADQQQQKIEQEQAKKQQIAQELEALKKKQEAEKQKLEALEIKRKQEEVEKVEREKKQKEEQKRLKIEKEEAEKKRKEAEKRKVEQEKLEKEKHEKEKHEKEKHEKEKREKEEAEQKRKEEEKRKKEAEEKKRQEAEKKRKAEEKKAREAALKKQLEQEQLARTKVEAANALSALVDRIAASVENNWRRPLNSNAGLKATIRVKVSRNGDVLSANVVKSSGDQFFDQSAELAVKKASPLPFPADPKYYEFINEFDLLFNPDAF